MSITCPKCGKVQPSENQECAQCGVVFKKLQTQRQQAPQASPPLNTPAREPPPMISQGNDDPPQNDFLPPIGLKSTGEIKILNILAYVYLILGMGSGVAVMIQAQNEQGFFVGLAFIMSSIIISMLFFVICTTAKKILSMDGNIAMIVELIQKGRE